jgi:hypothetical protein
MTQSQLAITRELRIAGTLLIFGLVVAIISLLWKSPAAFLLFAGVSGLLIVAGILVYLYSIISSGDAPQPNESARRT